MSRRANLDDLELMELARRGDREAFGDLYERHLRAIYRYCYYRTGDHVEAEDLTETVFLRAWEARQRFRATGAPLTAWLYRIAHNLLIDQRRSARETEPLGEDHVDPAAASDPAAAALERERRDQLVGWLRQLDAPARQVLSLRFIAGLSHAETARAMGKTEGAVRVLQHRALAALRRLAGGKDQADD